MRIHGWGDVGNVSGLCPYAAARPRRRMIPIASPRLGRSGLDKRHVSIALKTSPGMVAASVNQGADAAIPKRPREKGESPSGVRCRVAESLSPPAKRSTMSCASRKSRPNPNRACTRLTGCSIEAVASSTRSTGIPEGRWSAPSFRFRSRRSSASFNDDPIDFSLSQDLRTDGVEARPPKCTLVQSLYVRAAKIQCLADLLQFPDCLQTPDLCLDCDQHRVAAAVIIDHNLD